MRTDEFAKVVQGLISEGNTGYALKLMLLFLEDRDRSMHHDVLHLDQQFKEYHQPQVGSTQFSQGGSHIVLSLLSLTKKLERKPLPPLTPSEVQQVEVIIQGIPLEEKDLPIIDEPQSVRNRTISLFGGLATICLFLIGAFHYQPVPSSIDQWLEGERNDPEDTFAQAPSVDLSKGLLAYYTFEENAQDYSSFSHHGIVHHADNTSDRFGSAHEAFQFDGEQSWIELGNFYPGASISLSMWINAAESSEQQCLIAYNSSDLEAPLFSLGYSPKHIYTSLSNQQIYQVSPHLGYQHLVVLINAKKLNTTHVYIYRNGELIGEDIYSERIDPKKGGVWTLGNLWRKGELTDYFGGMMDEVRIYDRILNKAEIEALYTFEREAMPIAIE